MPIIQAPSKQIQEGQNFKTNLKATQPASSKPAWAARESLSEREQQQKPRLRPQREKKTRAGNVGQGYLTPVYLLTGL